MPAVFYAPRIRRLCAIAVDAAERGVGIAITETGFPPQVESAPSLLAHGSPQQLRRVNDSR